MLYTLAESGGGRLGGQGGRPFYVAKYAAPVLALHPLLPVF